MLRAPFTPAKVEGWGEGAGFLPQAEGWEKVLLKMEEKGKVLEEKQVWSSLVARL